MLERSRKGQETGTSRTIGRFWKQGHTEVQDNTGNKYRRQIAIRPDI
jgi:hypothetical protein